MIHPWIDAATEFGLPVPVQTVARMELIEMMRDGSPTDMILLTIATPVGVQTVFLDWDAFESFMGSGQAILKHVLSAAKPESEIKIQPATQTDLRNAVHGLSLLNGEIK